MADARGWKADGNAEKTSRKGQRGYMYRNSASIAEGSFGSYENSRHVEGDAVNETSRLDLGNVTRKPSIEDIEDSEDWDKLCDGLYLCSAGQLHRERSVYKGVLQQDSGDLQDIVVKLLERRKGTVEEDARELDILDQLSYHPHIVEIFCSGKCKYGGPKFFIAMEPCLQNLAEYIDDKDNSFDLSKATKFFYQTVSAINYIHENKIVHRDLKPSNILITFDRENIKVSDFGISRQLDPDRSDKTVSYKGAGTPGFKSPETLLNLDYSKIGLKADIYCLAICGCYIMTHGGHPFGTDRCYWEPNIKDNKNLNLSIVHKFPRTKAHKNEQLVGLLTKMLAHNQKDRPCAIEVLGDEFFEEVLHHETSTDGIGIEAASVQPAGSPVAPIKLNDSKQPEDSLRYIYISDSQDSDICPDSQDSDISDSYDELSDEDTDIEESVHLSETLLMFPNKKLSAHRNVVVGEMCSSIECENRSCVIKFDPNQIVREAAALRKLSGHSHVISLFYSGMFNDGMLDISYIVLERCHDLNLEDYLLCDDIVSVYDINRGLKFCKQIINGMKFVHEKLIIHKDLKPSNILLTRDLESVKIADFGSSQQVTSPSSMVPSTNIFGTLGYRPPESLEPSHVSLKSDIFSLGVVFCFILSGGKSPLGPHSDSWDYNTLHGTVNIPILLVPNPITIAHLVKSMLNKSRQCRPSVAQVDLHFCWSGKERWVDTDYPFEEEIEDSIIVESSQAEKYDLDAPISKFLQAVDKHEEILKLDSVWSGKDVPANAVLHPMAVSSAMKDSSRAIFETSEPGNGRAIGLREWELENELDKVAQMETNSRVDETISNSDTVGNAEQPIDNEPEKWDGNFNDVVEGPEISFESSDVAEDGETVVSSSLPTSFQTGEQIRAPDVSRHDAEADEDQSGELTSSDDSSQSVDTLQVTTLNQHSSIFRHECVNEVVENEPRDEEDAGNVDEPALARIATSTKSPTADVASPDEFSGNDGDMKGHKATGSKPKGGCSKSKKGKLANDKEEKVLLHVALFSRRSGSLVCPMWVDQSQWEHIRKDFKESYYEKVLIRPTCFQASQSQNIKVELCLADCQTSSEGRPFHIHGETSKSLPVSQVIESRYWDEYFLISPPTKNLVQDHIALSFSIHLDNSKFKSVPFHLKCGDEDEIKKEEQKLKEAKSSNINMSVITDSGALVRDSAVHTLAGAGGTVSMTKDGVTEKVVKP